MFEQFSLILTIDDRKAVIVDVYDEPAGYEIEYTDEQGSTYGITPDKIKKLIESA
jgi:hypothetical protein